MLTQVCPDLDAVETRLWQASGADPILDQALSKAFRVPLADYSASVDLTRKLAATLLPGHQLHVGYDASGIFPTAIMASKEHRVCETAGTVPLCILRALWLSARKTGQLTRPGRDRA
jgi:hypothetical protein